MIRLVVSLIGGLTLGGTYALIALGLVLAFRATHTFNFAHGQLMVLPAFIVGYAQAEGHPLIPAIMVAIAAGATIAALFYLFALRRATGLPLFMGIIATFGLAAMVDGLLGIFFHHSQYSIALPWVPAGSVKILGAGVSIASLLLAASTIAIALGVAVLILRTHLGTKIRAAGQNPILAGQSGIRVTRIHLGSWAAAGALAGIAGIAYGELTIVNHSMVHLGLAALPAIVLGGIDSIEGAVVGGLLIGLLQSFTQTYLGTSYLNVVTYSVLLLTLLLLPQGIFGTRQIVRA